MGKGAARLEAITRQNELLQEQNELLREQNELLRKSAAVSKSNEQEIFVENIDRDEMRNGFLVTSHRKKLWNTQINLIQEFARICEKHNLRWFAFYGTLLGAARHRGFIPWDDDVDIVMLRPDYSKFQKVAETEIKSPYFMDVWCNYRLESESASSNYDTNTNLQFVTLEEQKNERTGWRLEWPKIKLRDSRTCMILRPNLSSNNQGAWIDIFPFDPVPPFDNQQQALIFNAAKELHMAAMAPAWIKNAMDKKVKFTIAYEELQNLIAKPFHLRGMTLDNFMMNNFFESKNFGRVVRQFLTKTNVIYRASDFKETIYLPFEKIELPVPVGYENTLTASYGDWHEMVKYPPHILDYSVDISSEEYFKAVLQSAPQR